MVAFEHRSRRAIMLIVVERVLEALLFVVAAQAGRRLFGPADEPVPALARRLIRRRLPVTAIVITALLAAGALLQLAWPGALDALRQQPHGAWWRTFTAPFVQTGGALAGALFNIATAAIILAMAEWQWGRLAATSPPPPCPPPCCAPAPCSTAPGWTAAGPCCSR
jgi:hypothetical protein